MVMQEPLKDNLQVTQVDQVPGVFASALGELGYIFRTEKMDRLQEIIRFIHQADKDKEL